MKTIVMVETYRGKPTLNFFQWIVFAQGWFGMRPRLFEKFISKSLSRIKYFILTGVSRIVIGIILLALSKRIEEQITHIYFLSNLLMLAGISLILHFGILNLSTAIWRLFGVDVKELFRSPIKAKSLQEFWGKRWNLAFSEMTALVVYKPSKGNLGQTKAMMISFLVSGVLHEIAISLPVQSGYGLPLFYFLIHALAMYAEGEVLIVKRLLAHPVFSRVWVFSWLLLPMPLLFHSNFLIKVAEPIRNGILNLIDV
ncbi:MAG: membrane bound O-acyl transferase family-domain-containing protein [Chryseolinea sp.]